MLKLAVPCNNCEQIILLPSTKPPQLAIDQLPFDTDDLPTNVLCPHCIHATAYSPDRFRAVFVQRPLPDRFDGDQVCVCMQYACDEKGCAALVSIHTPMTVSEHMHEEALQRSAGLFAVNVLCKKGHTSSGRALGGSFRVLLSPGLGTAAVKRSGAVEHLAFTEFR